MGHRRYGYKAAGGGGLSFSPVSYYPCLTDFLDVNSVNDPNVITGITFPLNGGFDNKNSAALFNGTSSEVEIPYATTLPINNDGTNEKAFSISYLLFNDDGGTIPLFIRGKSGGNRSVTIDLTSGQGIRYILWGTGNGFYTLDGENAPQSQWTHIIHTYNGSGLPTGMSAYKNGIAYGSTSVTGTYTQGRSNTDALQIGRRDYISTQRLKGKLQNIRFFDFALNAAQATELYNLDTA